MLFHAHTVRSRCNKLQRGSCLHKGLLRGTTNTISHGRLFILLLVALLGDVRLKAQNSSMNFHKLGIAEGLHDGIVRCIAQDKHGYIWIGTVGALNRFDGKHVTQYAYAPGDSTLPYSSQPRCMHTDKTGRFWIGMETGLLEYHVASDNFTRIPAFKNNYINAIESMGDSVLFVLTRKNFYRYNKNSKQLCSYYSTTNKNFAQLQGITIHAFLVKESSLFLATSKGLYELDCKRDELKPIGRESTRSRSFVGIDLTATGKICAYEPKQKTFYLFASGNTRVDSITPFLKNKYNSTIEITGFLFDPNDNLWMISRKDGLFRYNPRTHIVDSFQHQVLISSSTPSNSYRCLFKDNNEVIWLGCDVEGITFFKPNQDGFTTILPFPENLKYKNNPLGRAVTVDKNNFIWMGNHDGLSCYNPQTKEYKVWHNEEGKTNVLYSNIIRSLYCDEANNIWIGTGNGVNCYHNNTGIMEFIDPKKLPRSWYNSINGDKSGNIWFCTNDTASLYWYSIKNNSFHSIAHHPFLKKYKGYTPTSYVFEDSKQRLWISLSRKGIVMFDQRNNTLHNYKAQEQGGNYIIGNQIIEIKEDKNGTIWFSTFNGLSSLNPQTGMFSSWNEKNGLPGNLVGPIAIDNNNQLWAGVNGGITMLQEDRKKTTVFTVDDGLPSVGFHEHAGVSTNDGSIIFPTYIGYVLFNPKKIQEHHAKFPFYVSSYTINHEGIIRLNESINNPSIQLKPKQNSFTFHLIALNFMNPTRTWFAYKLEGFENNWHYTQDPKAVYTNVPGGNYQFIYKAAGNKYSWDSIEPKKLQVELATFFYKTNLFRISILIGVLGFIYFLFRYRSKQRDQLYLLREKAQLLEKEKAMVLYENLKQQLNPHFLFNSLTSLNSLIKINPKNASRFLENLSKTYRYILKSRDHETVSLQEEIKFAEQYVELQKMRFDTGLEVIFNIEENYLHHKIVPVTLQNLIENATKHNIVVKEKPLQIEIYTQHDFLIIQNKLQKKNYVETSNKQGLSQLQSFYTFLSSIPVEIIETESTFSVKIPLIQ